MTSIYQSLFSILILLRYNKKSSEWVATANGTEQIATTVLAIERYHHKHYRYLNWVEDSVFTWISTVFY
jgi:hypothetical protein